ncbi:MAG: hypothetical protein GX053_01445 [Tissierella sp.]|nr:hypothetical protein [Tissierella sp.]
MEKPIKKLKEISLINNRNRILKNYYSKELRKGKTYRASNLDKVLLYGIMFLLLSTILIIRSNQFLLSIFISSIGLYFLIIINSRISKKAKTKRITEINDNLKKKKLIREFSSLNKEGFTNYIEVIFKDFYEVDIEKAELPLDLKFTKDKDIFGVKCIKASMEDRIGTRELEVFSKELDNLGLKDGILVTNTHFTDGLQEDTKIILLDFNNIVDILIKLDKYPSDKDMEDYIVDRFIDRRNGIKTQVKDFNKKKIIQLYGLCAIFYILSFFISFPLYYKIMAVVSFVIATLVSGYKISEYIRLKDSLNIDQN